MKGGSSVCLLLGPQGPNKKAFKDTAVEVVCEWNPSDLSGTVAQTGPRLLFPLWMPPDTASSHHWEHFRFSKSNAALAK